MESFDELRRVLEEKRSRDGRLSRLADFYCDLFLVQSRHLEEIGPIPVEASLDTAIARVEQGSPAYEPHSLPIDSNAFRSLFVDLARVMDKHGLLDAGDRQKLRSLAENLSETSRPTSVLPGEGNEEQSGSSLRFLLSAAMFPFLKTYADSLLPRLNLSLWRMGICPICGGEPSFAALSRETRERSLLCSRCAAIWPFKRLGCPFCDNEHQDLLSYYPVEDGRYRVFLCDNCHRYLKAIDLARTGLQAVSLLVESLSSEELDEVALSMGYTS